MRFAWLHNMLMVKSNTQTMTNVFLPTTDSPIYILWYCEHNRAIGASFVNFQSDCHYLFCNDCVVRNIVLCCIVSQWDLTVQFKVTNLIQTKYCSNRITAVQVIFQDPNTSRAQTGPLRFCGYYTRENAHRSRSRTTIKLLIFTYCAVECVLVKGKYNVCGNWIFISVFSITTWN